MSNLTINNSKTFNELLKMSMIPLSCQESQLNDAGSTTTENIDWLLDLKHETPPIWSRLNDINSSGFKRKLPMSMTKGYDIEINGRLWSLWGHKQKYKISSKISKSYMAITVTALCAARVINLNLWNRNLMDCIRDNGRKYYKKSLKKFGGCSADFQLSDMESQCSLEGVRCQITLKAVEKGQLYATQVEDLPNLATALEKFFNCYQFGILECCNRLMGLGLIGHGPQRGYFMYDAQTNNYPLFAKNVSAPYLLRTNHLQILLYCVIVTLNVYHSHEPFKLHHVAIELVPPYQTTTDHHSVKVRTRSYPRIIPSKCWKTPSIFSLKHQSSKTSSNLKSGKASIHLCPKVCERKTRTKTLYRRKLHNIKREKVERSPIKPLVDPDRGSDEEIQIKKDFLRLICSKTAVPLMPADLPKSFENEFSCDLLDALIMGPKACIMFEDL